MNLWALGVLLSGACHLSTHEGIRKEELVTFVAPGGGVTQDSKVNKSMTEAAPMASDGEQSGADPQRRSPSAPPRQVTSITQEPLSTTKETETRLLSDPGL